jgi:hypothetical protein
LEAFQAKALKVNQPINAVVEFLEDALTIAKNLVNNFEWKMLNFLNKNSLILSVNLKAYALLHS